MRQNNMYWLQFQTRVRKDVENVVRFPPSVTSLRTRVSALSPSVSVKSLLLRRKGELGVQL